MGVDEQPVGGVENTGGGPGVPPEEVEPSYTFLTFQEVAVAGGSGGWKRGE